MARLRRGDRSVIVAIGVRRHAAEHLPHEIAALLNADLTQSP